MGRGMWNIPRVSVPSGHLCLCALCLLLMGTPGPGFWGSSGLQVSLMPRSLSPHRPPLPEGPRGSWVSHMSRVSSLSCTLRVSGGFNQPRVPVSLFQLCLGLPRAQGHRITNTVTN